MELKMGSGKGILLCPKHEKAFMDNATLWDIRVLFCRHCKRIGE